MTTLIKEYSELTTDELYEILKHRCLIYVVEQNCNYLDMDDKDKNAKHIMILDDGKLVGKGTHEELFKTCNVYKEICMSQFSSQEVAQL